MNTLVIEKLGEPRRIQGVSQRTGKPYDFTKYSFASGGAWFEYDGKDGEELREGQSLLGEVKEETYPKSDGTQGSKKIFKPVSEETKTILKMIKNIQAQIDELKSPKEAVEDNEEIDLPF